MCEKVNKVYWLGLIFSILLITSFVSSAELDARYSLIQMQNHYSSQAKTRIIAWQAMMNSLQEVSELEQLQQVNHFFNQLQFVDDIDQWGQQDYWATPVEFLTRNGGDCEDFAIAKYFTLLHLGIAKDKLRLTYVKLLPSRQAHMVLSYRVTDQAVPLLLDNLNLDIIASTERNDLHPVYSFNDSGMWLAKTEGGGRYLSSTQRPKQWLDLQQRTAYLPRT